MEIGAIKHAQIQASSEWDLNHAAIQGRLNFQKSGIKQGAWSARKNDNNQWLQIDLQAFYTKVTAVASQGRNQVNQWVTKYKLQYSNDGVTFQYYRVQGQTVDKVRCDDKQFVKMCSEGNTRLGGFLFLNRNPHYVYETGKQTRQWKQHFVVLYINFLYRSFSVVSFQAF